MLIIRDAQLSYINETISENFLRSVIDTVRENHTEYVSGFTNDELYTYVTHGLTKAKDFGLVKADDLLRFASLLLVVGWYFDRYKPFDAILYRGDEGGTPSDRFALLVNTASNDDWRDAAAFSSAMLDVDPPDWIEV